MSIVNFEPLKPLDGNWTATPAPKQEGVLYQSAMGLRVISAVHLIDGKPEYHISISDNGARCPASIVPVILRQFGATDFIEDNHSPLKIIRSFWKKITEPQRDCECSDEKPEVDGDFVWREEKAKK